MYLRLVVLTSVLSEVTILEVCERARALLFVAFLATLFPIEGLDVFFFSMAELFSACWPRLFLNFEIYNFLFLSLGLLKPAAFVEARSGLLEHLNLSIYLEIGTLEALAGFFLKISFPDTEDSCLLGEFFVFAL